MADARLGADYVGRREIFEVLSAAGGSMPFNDLLAAVTPRLRRLITRVFEIKTPEGYLRQRLNEYRGPSGSGRYQFRTMVFWDPDSPVTNPTITLNPNFVMWAEWPDGKIRKYKTGIAAALDTLSDIDRRITALRESGGFTGVVPTTDESAVKMLADAIAQRGFYPHCPIIRDRTRSIIDGRTRERIAQRLVDTGKLNPGDIRYLDLDVSPSEGLIMALDINHTRFSGTERRTSRSTFTEKVQHSVNQVQTLLDNTAEWRRYRSTYRPTVSGLPTTSVEIPVQMTVLEGDSYVDFGMSVDGEWVHLRSACRAAGAETYVANKHKDQWFPRALEFKTTSPRGRNNKAVTHKGIWVPTDDFIEVYNIRHWKEEEQGWKMHSLIPIIKAKRAELAEAPVEPAEPAA